MDGFCRGCLNKFDDPFELLQYSEERRRLFVYCSGLQVKRNDVFTFQLCKECYNGMKTSCKFKKMCRTSDKKIKNYLSLREVDDGMDFSTYLKRNDESFRFRLPILSGASTPANQRVKEDDNESTCTSIQNFMTDILRAEEIPDSEARIIREVIEEEADVLEDSLDSHWLEDDAVDEFRLDLSLSRFSTPRSTNYERMTSPDGRDITSTEITSGEDYDNMPIDVSFKKLSDPVENSYLLNNLLEKNVQNDTKKMRCVIDKNLEKALKDENNQEFSLEELLASPVFPSKSGASTPTIKHIIFGDKIKNSKKSKSPKFECDLDSLIGKLDKQVKSQEQLQKGKYESRGTGKLIEGKHESRMKTVMKLEKGNVGVGKLTEGKHIDLGKYSAGKVLQEKLDISKGKLNEEKKQFKGKLGKFYEDSFNLENFEVETVSEEAQPLLDNENRENQNDGKLDVNIEMLLEDNDRNLDVGNRNNAENVQVEVFREPAGEYLEEDSDEDILEEFLNAEKEKLANVEMKKKAVTNMVNAAQINDAELTELLQEAFDHDVETMKGKKMLNSQSPHKGVKLLKKMFSPIENKYCITNFYCKMCDLKFKTLKALKIHFTRGHRYKITTPKKHWMVKVKMCDLCGKTFTNTKSLVRHLENHDKPKEYSCENCMLTFKSEHTLKNHKVTHTRAVKSVNKLNDSNLKYVCKICGAISSSSSNHITHERRHSKSYTLHCEDCGKGFYRKSEMITHRRKHTGEKPFSCLYCDQSFSRRDTLNRHLKCHTDEKRYSCQYCNKKFTKSYDVKIHQANNKNCLQLRVH